MINPISRGIIAITVLVLAGSTLAGDPPVKQTKEPKVPEALASKGQVYHTISGRQAQVTFTSKAPLENIVGKSNAIVGYAVTGPEDSPAELAGAQWLLPVASLATGIPLRDEHLADDEWLAAEDFPLITFTLKSTEKFKLIKTGDGFSTWRGSLIGEMTMHGTTRKVRVDDTTISFLEESPKTMPIAKGDLMFIKCAYTVKLSDFGILHKDVPDKVSDVVSLTQMLRLSTVPQEPIPSAEKEGDEESKSGSAARSREKENGN